LEFGPERSEQTK